MSPARANELVAHASALPSPFTRRAFSERAFGRSNGRILGTCGRLLRELEDRRRVKKLGHDSYVVSNREHEQNDHEREQITPAREIAPYVPPLEPAGAAPPPWPRQPPPPMLQVTIQWFGIDAHHWIATRDGRYCRHNGLFNGRWEWWPA